MKKTYNIYEYTNREVLVRSDSYYSRNEMAEVDVQIFVQIGEFETYEKAYEYLQSLYEDKKSSYTTGKETYTILECFKF